jgi:hypothetical protein
MEPMFFAHLVQVVSIKRTNLCLPHFDPPVERNCFRMILLGPQLSGLLFLFNTGMFPIPYTSTVMDAMAGCVPDKSPSFTFQYLMLKPRVLSSSLLTAFLHCCLCLAMKDFFEDHCCRCISFRKNSEYNSGLCQLGASFSTGTPADRISS